MLEDDEIIREFLMESNENLNRLDTEILELEKNPTADRLASIFRTIHTIKGTCGFLGFQTLEGISHHAETILSQLRTGQRQVTGNLVSVILESLDAARQILGNIESMGQEGDNAYTDLVRRLERTAAESASAHQRQPVASQTAATAPPPDIPMAHPIELELAAVAPAAAVSVSAPTSVPPPEAEKAGGIADASIRVDVSLLDKLMNLVGELVLARNQILQFASQRNDSGLTATSQRLNLITSQLQEGVMKTRMQPIGMILNKFPRVVRDVAHALGKQLELVVEGADTELDKTIIEAIKDPLMHMVRNACDHGVEDAETRRRRGKPATGTLRLKAYHESGQVNIEISDDGAGIDVERVTRKAVERGLIRAEQAAAMTEREAIGLLFLPGFSTALTVTSLSGRGVGMDVVRANVEKIGGTVDISTKLGAGTTVKLKIPLTLAIIPGLVITSGGHRFVIPQVSLLELIRLEADALARIEFVHETPVYRRRGALLPITYLNEVLKLPPSAAGEARNILVLQAEDRQFGLVVDGVHDTQEIVVKPLSAQLKGLACYSGSTIMGDGAVALILDAPGIGRRSGVFNLEREPHRRQAAQPAAVEAQKQRLLLFKSGSFERLAVPLELVARLEEIAVSSVEYAGGRRAVQYRDRILPLIALSAILNQGAGQNPNSAAMDDAHADPLQVVVFSNSENSIGLIVDQIVDIVDDAVTMRSPSSPRPGILGSAVVGKKVADFLDLQFVIEATGERFFTLPENRLTTVLLAESSSFNRGLLRSQLQMSGYEVLEAANAADVRGWLDRVPVQVLIVGSDLMASDPPGMEIVRQRTAAARIPILALSNTQAELLQQKVAVPPFDDHQLRSEREAMLRSIARLARAADSSGVSAEPAGFEKANEFIHA